jgi:hypothetical protein
MGVQRSPGLVVVVVLVSGCDLVFTLTPPSDAKPAEVDACWNESLRGNEDGDGYADGCDPCPADPDLDPFEDADGDLVGDACDPAPGVSGESILVFDGFEGPMNAWAESSGAWSYQSGQFVQALVEDAVNELAIPTTLRAAFETYIVLGGANSGTGAGAYVERSDTGQEISCAFEFQSAPTPDRVVLALDTTIVNTAALDHPADGVLRMTLFQDTNGVVHCTGSFGAGTVDALGVIPLGTTTRVGLKTKGAEARFNSFTVFGTN